MKFKILDSKRLVNVDISKSLVDWDAKIKRGKNFGAFQYNVKQLLRPHWENQVVLEEFSIPAIVSQRGRSFDIVNLTKRVVIEVDGGGHLAYNEFFHKNKFGFLRQLQRDLWKDEFCELNNLKMVRIYPEDELNDELLKKMDIL